jgi:pre-mRNA-splicing factor ATP-dependent RNA helicase DHX38/PRP16
MEAELEQRLKGSNNKRMDSRQRLEENVKWEENQLVNSGIFRMTGQIADEDHDEKRVMLMVHDLKPPFLDGNIAYTTQMSQIQVVKDPLSDMAILAKKGSTVVKELRERNERQRTKQKEDVENERLKKLLEKKQDEK